MPYTTVTFNGNEYEIESVEDLSNHPDLGHKYTKKYNLIDYMRPNKKEPRYTELFERVPTEEGVTTYVQKERPIAGGGIITNFPEVTFIGNDAAPAGESSEGSTPPGGDGADAQNPV